VFELAKPFHVDDLVAVVEEAACELKSGSERDEAEVVTGGPGQASLLSGEE
jgi:hypothetical protein